MREDFRLAVISLFGELGKKEEKKEDLSSGGMPLFNVSGPRFLSSWICP